MNKIYKTVWNAARRCLVVVSEATKSALQKSGSSREKGCEVGQLRASQTFGFKHSKFAFDDFGVSRLVIAMIAAFSIIGTASAAPSWEGDLDRDYRQNIADGLIIDDGEWGLAHEGNYALSYAGSVTIEQGSAFGSMIRDGVNVWLNKSSNIFYNHGGLYLSAWKDGGTYYFSNGAGIQNYAGANLVFGYLNGTSWADGVQFNEGSFLQNSGSTWNQSIFLLDGGTITNNGSWINETDSFTMNSGTFTGSGNFQNLAQASVNGGTFRTGTLTLVAGNFNSGSTLVVGNQSGNLSTATLNLNGGALGTKISQTGGNVNVNGTYTLSNFNKTGGTLTNNQTLTLSGANIGASGSFVNNKTLKLTGNNTISGTITGSGTVSISGTANVAGISGAASVAVTSGTASIQSVNTAKIDNAGALTITNFAKDSDVTYTQTGGSLTANTDWLTNSIFNIRGGSLTRDVLGENTFNVAGGTVSTDTLTSDTTLNLSSGTFKTNHLALTEGQTAKVSGGTFQTAIEEMFTGLEGSTEDALKTIGLSASVPEEIKTTLTSWFQKYAPGTVIEGLADHITMTGGKVVVTGVNLTTTMRDDLTKAFKETFGEATSIEFQGTISGVSQNDILNTAKVNELYDQAGLKDVIYVDRALEAEGQSVVIGDSGVKNSTGFTHVNSDKGVSVEDGKTLVLIGTKAGQTLASGTIGVKGNNSKLQLGTLGLADGADYQGTATKVELDGASALNVVNGQYNVSTIQGNSSSSLITVNKGANLQSDTILLNGGSQLTNEGSMVVNSSLEGTTQANIHNRQNAELTVNGKTSVIGELVNDGTFVARDEVTVNGGLTNNGNATISLFKVLGFVNNTGTLDTSETSFVNGQLTNTGVINLYNTTNIDEFSFLNNTKTLDAEGTVTMNGQLANLDNADFESLVIDGESGQMQNKGTLVVENLTLQNGAYNKNGGSLLSKIAEYIPIMTMADAGAVETVININVDESSSETNAGTAYYGQGTIAGTLTNTQGALAYGGVSTGVEDGKGLTVTETGTITNGGTFTMGGAFANAGTVNGDGKLIFQRAAAATNLFTNSGTIDVGEFEADNITFTQTAGSFNARSGWFANSLVNLEGGEVAHDTLGSGNTFNVGKSGETSKVATLNLDTLDSESTLNIIEGGYVHADKIAMTKDEKTTHLSGGTLATTLNQIFSDVFYTALDIDAENPEDIVNIEGVKVATGVSDVIESVSKGIEFGWGTVAFDDASYSASMAGDVLQKLDAIDVDPQGHEGQLEVVFNGDAAQSFNVDLANSVIAKDPQGGSTYATFANEELTNTVSANTGYTALYVGKAETDSAVVQPALTDFNNLHSNAPRKLAILIARGIGARSKGVIFWYNNHIM